MQTFWGKVECGSVDGAGFQWFPMPSESSNGYSMPEEARGKDNQRSPWGTLADSWHVTNSMEDCVPFQIAAGEITQAMAVAMKMGVKKEWFIVFLKVIRESYALSCFIDLLVPVILPKPHSNQFASQSRKDKPFCCVFCVQERARSSLIAWSAFTPLWQRPWRCSSVLHKGCAFDSQHKTSKSRGEGKEYEKEV